MKFIRNVSLVVLLSPLVRMMKVKSIGWLEGIVTLEATTYDILCIMFTLPVLIVLCCVRFNESE